MNLKAQQGRGHEECVRSSQEGVAHTSSKAYLELQRKVQKLEAQNKKQKSTIKQLKYQLVGNAETGACCCTELREIHREKEDKLNKISDAWKQKTYALVNEHQKNV